ncbi:hypothetical protein K5X82_02010 [Halosquirtibacter xylanolyticus]|uniref:hypothetical protein n=1 Tax=Halosquirtibacter xylanolyticus TaxID=3374599 RepID=UPI00374849CA|nr:hypothetical protein K5X82_02010 [Prolixibacteraceae bacterium]
MNKLNEIELIQQTIKGMNKNLIKSIHLEIDKLSTLEIDKKINKKIVLKEDLNSQKLETFLDCLKKEYSYKTQIKTFLDYLLSLREDKKEELIDLLCFCVLYQHFQNEKQILE